MKLGNAIKMGLSKSIEIDDSMQYTIAGVQSYGKGIINRRTELGKNLKMKKYQVIEPDYLMWCKVDTKNGAFGITKPEHAWSLASTNMALAKIDTEKFNPFFLERLFTFEFFYGYITHLSSGSTNRKYLTPKQLCELVQLPNLSKVEQDEFICLVDSIEKLEISNELTHQLDLVKQLRQAFLREAMHGKLVPQDPNDEPASDLLKKIKAEKEQLIKQGKIKKQKPFPPNSEDEIPFEIPKNWVWCRLGEIIELKSGQDLKPTQYSDSEEIGLPYITGASNLENEKVVISRWTKDPKSIAYNGELLLTCKGSGLGKMAWLEIEKAHIARQIMAISTYSVSPKFVKSILDQRVKEYRSKAKSQIPGIDRDTVLHTLIPLPPISEQHRIVAKLYELMQYCDELEASIKESQQQNEMLLQQVLREALEPKLN